MAESRANPGSPEARAGATTVVVEALVVQATRLAVGAALVAGAGISALLSSSEDGRTGEAPSGEAPSGEATAGAVAPTVAAAALAVALEAERRAVEVARLVDGGVRTAVNAARLVLPRAVTQAFERRVLALTERGRSEARVGVEGVVEAWNRLLDDLVAQVLAHVDLEDVIASVDLDAIVDRVDVDRILGRIDLDEIAGRIDLDAVARRIDVEGLVRELDLAGIAREVLDEIGVETIIRESTGSLTVQTVDALRASGADADRWLSHVVDRLLQRRHERDVKIEDGNGSAAPSQAPSGPTLPTRSEDR